MLPWSVIATAGMPSRLASPSSSLTRAAPSSIEYSVCTWRCTNESDTRAPLVVTDASDSSRPVRQKRGGSRGCVAVTRRTVRSSSTPRGARLGGSRAGARCTRSRTRLERRVVGHDRHRAGAGARSARRDRRASATARCRAGQQRHRVRDQLPHAGLVEQVEHPVGGERGVLPRHRRDRPAGRPSACTVCQLELSTLLPVSTQITSWVRRSSSSTRRTVCWSSRRAKRGFSSPASTS